MPLWMQCRLVQTPYGLWNTLRLHSSLAEQYGGKYRACRTHNYGRLSDLTRTTIYRPKVVGSPSLKAVHAHISDTGYMGPYGSKRPTKNRTTPQRGHTPSLIRIFAVRLKDTKLRSRIKLSWSHMPFRFCHAQVHISQLLRNFITIVCFHTLKQTEFKLHVLRQ